MKNIVKDNVYIIAVIGVSIVIVSLIALFSGNAGEPGADAENQSNSNTVQNTTDQEDGFPLTNTSNPTATLRTGMGDIVLELYVDKTPKTAGNFIDLAEQGFYSGTKFHRVIENFMIQGGDPNTKGSNTDLYGRGGPGYTISDEFAAGLSNLRGTISMANIGQPNSGGSQFFINFTNNVGLDFDKQPLTSKHPVFGHVVSGMAVIDAIAKVATNERDLPLEPITIEEVLIQEGKAENVSPENSEVPGEEGTPTEETEL